jgi:hypothetical protein
MAKKLMTSGPGRERVQMVNLVCLGEAILKLQGLMIEALETLPTDLEVPVSAEWLSQVARPLGIRVGKGCACASAGQTTSRSIRVGKAC